MNKLLVIIPVYNEEKNIRGVITGIRRHFARSADILVINDASTDDSLRIIEQNRADHVTLIARLKYGAVLQTGFKYAQRHGYSLVATLDGDGQHDPRSLGPMIAEVERGRADLVIGSRCVLYTGYPMPWARRLGTAIFSGMIQGLSHTRVRDPTSGLQVFNEKVLAFYCQDDYPSDYPDADELLRLLYAGVRVRELPVQMRPNRLSSMHSGLSTVYYVLKMFLSIFVVFLSFRRTGRTRGR